MWRRARFNPPRKVGAYLGQILANLGLQDGLYAEQTREIWPNVVGRRVAEVTVPGDVTAHVLSVVVTSTAWRAELHLLRPDIVRKLNRALGRDFLKDIRFVLTPDPVGAHCVRPADQRNHA